MGADERRARAAACTSRATAATRGSSSTGKGLPEGVRGARSASRWRPSDPRARLRADRSREGRALPLRRRRRDLGRSRATTARSGSGPGTTRRSPSTRTNPDVVWFPQVPLLKTIDGGKTFKRVKGIHHGDHHDLWIDPKNPRRMIDGQRRRRGRHDRRRRDLVRAAAADLAVLPRRGRHTRAVPRHGRDAGPRHGLGPEQQPPTARHPHSATGTRVGGGEAGHAVADPTDPDIVYAGEYGGILTRYDHRTAPGAQRLELVARQPVRPRRRRPAIPLPVDGPDRDLAARPEDGLPRRQRALPHARRRPDAGRRSAPT